MVRGGASASPAGREFEIAYVDAESGERRLALIDAWSVPFEECMPVRGFPSYKGQRQLARPGRNLHSGVLMMADRVMRGSRLGAVSYETDRNHDLAPRQIARYRTENGEEFEVPFADDAEIPGTWLCRNGMEGTLIDGGDLAEPKKVKVPRTPWDMLRERRSIEELEELLKERLEIIKSRRRGS